MEINLKAELLKKFLKEKEHPTTKSSERQETEQLLGGNPDILVFSLNLSGKSFIIKKFLPKIYKFNLNFKEIAVRIFQLFSSFKFCLQLFPFSSSFFFIFFLFD